MNIIDMRPVRTPFAPLNKLLGPLGGFKRGEMVMINSLPGEYGRELADDLLLGTVLSNTPRLLDENKSPIVLRIHCSDSDSDTTGALLGRAKQELGGNVENISETMYSTGIALRNIKMIEKQYDLAAIYGRIHSLESEGYEVSFMVAHDLDKLREVKTGTLQLRDVYASLYETFKSKQVTIVTVQNLSDEVDVIRKKNPEKYLAIAADHSLFTPGVRYIDQVVDIQILVGCDKDNSKLTLQIGKHRGVSHRSNEMTYHYNNTDNLPFTYMLAEFTNVHPITVDDMSHAKSNLTQTPISGQVDRIVFYALEDIGNIMKTQINETLNDNELSFRVTNVKYKYNDRCYATINGIESRIDIDVTAEDGEVKGFNFTASTKLMDDNPVTLYVEDKSYDLRNAFHRLALAYHLLHEVNHGDVAALSFD